MTTKTTTQTKPPSWMMAQAVEQRGRATLDDHCDHTNLNAHKTRCLSCGMWLLLREWRGQ